MSYEVVCRESFSRNCLQLLNGAESASKRSDCDSSEVFLSEEMREIKKDRKRPELQIYRPGMGLQKNKAKVDDAVDGASLQNFTSENAKSSPVTHAPANASCHEDHSKTSKDSNSNNLVKLTFNNKEKCKGSSARYRRPDLQVYTPKPRLAATFKGDEEQSNLNFVPEGNFKTQPEKEIIMQRPESKNRRKKSKNSNESKVEPPKKSYMNKPRKNVQKSRSCNHSERNSPDSSCSRSTPEGFSEDSSNLLSETFKVDSSQSFEKTVSKDKHDGKTAPIKISECVITNSKLSSDSKYSSWANTDFDEKCLSDSAISNSHQKLAVDELNCDNRSGRIISKPVSNEKVKNCDKSDRVNDKIQCDKTIKKNVCDKVGTVSDKVVKGMHSTERKVNREESNTCKNRNDQINVKEKSSRRNKREKPEHQLPPRLQKQKHAANSELPEKCDMSEVKGGGGILRVPIESLSIEIPSITTNDRFSPILPPQYSPQQFVHKQLFNPKNPDVPEIINIPAVPNLPDYVLQSPHSDHAPRNAFIDPPLFLSYPRTADDGYIPPPQPAPSGGHYQYQSANFPSVINIRNTNIPHVPQNTDSLLCQVNDPRLVNGSPPIKPPVYSNKYVLAPSNEKKKLKPIVEKNLKEISMLERDLASNLSKGYSASELNSLRQCRWKLQLRYENIILADPRYCAERNAEQQLWKSAYYQIIEPLRKNLEEQPDNKDLKESLLNLVHEGTVFYENLLEKQQETFGFNLAQILEKGSISSCCIPDSLRLVVISTQKILIYLGDLARYKEQASGTTNFGKARSLYLKAQQLAPKNGRPYHQLAILALCARRKLDAVYYFMRSLAASNPFLSAQEYLLSLFEDAKKKYEKKRQDELANEIEIISADLGERCEVWIKPDGSKIQHDSLFDLQRADLEFKKLSNVELNKRFVTSFLHVHGKLFTKVGMESFEEVASQMLKEFYYLLQRMPFPLESSRLLQLSAINMYAVANSSVKDNALNGHQHSLLQVQALGVTQAMMCLIMQRCCTLHKYHMMSPEYPRQLICDDMSHLFPTVKIWTDWMSCQRDLWPLCVHSGTKASKYGFEIDIWSSFAQLLNILKEIDTASMEFVYEKQEGLVLVGLEEDSALSGFVPLLEALQEPAYMKPPFDKENVKNLLRISRIQFFGDYLCGIPTPYLEFDVEHRQFNSLVSSSSEKDGSKSGSDVWDNTDESFGDDSLDSDEVILNSSLDDESNEIKLLWSKKEALSKAKAQQEKYNARVQAVLQKNQTQRPIVLQIQPRYLIPDTNCFIDYLEEIKELLLLQTFHLIVPLIVINELDGLARGMKDNSSSTPEHMTKVTAFSRAAVRFLEQEFALRNAYLRAITSKGSLMDTISFRVEEVGCQKRGTNDDLILSCCLFHCKDRAEQYMPKNKDEPLQLLREVVLLTDDRNLRVKALTHNVPARDLQSFLKWAKS